MSNSSPDFPLWNEILDAHLNDGTRPGGQPGRLGTRWSPKSFADAVGSDASTVRKWLRGVAVPPECETAARILFGVEAENYEVEARQFRKAWAIANAKKRRPGRKKKAAAVDVPSHVFEASGLERSLLIPDLDAVPETQDLTLKGVEFGEGCRIERVPAASLVWLPVGTRMVDSSGRFDGTTRFVPSNVDEQPGALFFPRYIRVMGERPDARWEVQLYIITDNAYANGGSYRGRASFELTGVVGKGGIAAFVDRWGNPVQPNAVEVGGGLGCAAVFTAVAFANGEPVCRTPYFVGVRRGVRYPDDVWLSSATGQPISSRPDALEQGRFVFQSWEADGGSRDLFVADFNGQRQCNLNRDDGSALEAFADDDGREVVGWLGDGRIQFASNANGNGFLETMVRSDCWEPQGR